MKHIVVWQRAMHRACMPTYIRSYMYGLYAFATHYNHKQWFHAIDAHVVYSMVIVYDMYST